VHSLSSCCSLLTALVLFNSVVIWCNTTQFFTKMVLLYMFMCMGIGKSFPGGPLVDFSKSFSRDGGPKVVKFVFYHSKLRKQPFLLKFSNSWPPSDTHAEPSPESFQLGALRFCGGLCAFTWGLDILVLVTPLILVFHVSIWGLGAFFGGDKPTKASPVATGLHPCLCVGKVRATPLKIGVFQAF